MIHILHKKDCCGCNACAIICPQSCITLISDQEGFLYPNIKQEKCIHCELCDKVCPLINKTVYVDRCHSPHVFAAWNIDKSVRLDSTSGGVFSALAEKMFELGGYVGGAVYLDDHTVSHILTKDRKDLDAIRSSKYLQSHTAEIFINLKKILDCGGKAIICAAPCQIRALYNVIGKDYPDLITCDFICRGVNSPKVFLKYINMLERQYGAKAIKIKFKNKTYGWHRFATRIDFANGRVYIKDRYNDPFMLGYLNTNSFVRPSCYTCKFKDLPRQADITLADFWGIEKICPDLDNDCGTSLVLINSEKGFKFFKSVSDKVFSQEHKIEDAMPGNPAMIKSLEEKPGREQFFRELDILPFEQLAQKYFPVPNRAMKFLLLLSKIKTKIKKFLNLRRQLGNSPISMWQCLYINCFRKNTKSTKKFAFVPTPYCSISLDKSANIELHGKFVLGFKQFGKSRIESQLYVGKDASFIVNGDFTVYSGSDIRVYPGGQLILNSGFCNNGVEITCGRKITIGKDCAIARGVIIRDYDAHQITNSDHEIAKEISIGDHVWIGNRAIILKGVTIGNDAVIAAGSIVTKDVSEKCLVAGIPAKVIRNNINWI